LEYALDERDFLTYQLFTASQSKRIRGKRARNYLLVPLLYAATGYIVYRMGERFFFRVMLFVTVLWILGYPFYSHFLYKRHYKNYIRDNYKNRIGNTGFLELGDECIESRDSSGEGKLRYSEVEKILEISTHYFVGLKTPWGSSSPRTR